MKGAGTYPYKRRVSDKKMKNSELKEYLNSFPHQNTIPLTQKQIWIDDFLYLLYPYRTLKMSDYILFH